MNAKAEELYREALYLPHDERVALAERLLETAPVDPVPTDEDLRALQQAIDAGQRDIDAGRVTAAEEVLRELESR
jgi:predicted transcriptional regulator